MNNQKLLRESGGVLLFMFLATGFEPRPTRSVERAKVLARGRGVLSRFVGEGRIPHPQPLKTELAGRICLLVRDRCLKQQVLSVFFSQYSLLINFHVIDNYLIYVNLN